MLIPCLLCSGSCRRQVISSHYIKGVKMCSSLRAKLNKLHHFNVKEWYTCICKYMYMFPYKIPVYKGLSWMNESTLWGQLLLRYWVRSCQQIQRWHILMWNCILKIRSRWLCSWWRTSVPQNIDPDHIITASVSADWLVQRKTLSGPYEMALIAVIGHKIFINYQQNGASGNNLLN